MRAYVALLSLKSIEWAIRHHPDDVARQRDRAERVLDRFGVQDASPQ